jgi:predicted GIY-YIG superfamily endonuclease
LNKYVVYLIVAGNSHYVGITDCVSRRMQQHIDKNTSIINASVSEGDGKIYYTIVHIADDKEGARAVEEKINTTMQYIHPKFILNKVR